MPVQLTLVYVHILSKVVQNNHDNHHILRSHFGSRLEQVWSLFCARCFFMAESSDPQVEASQGDGGSGGCVRGTDTNSRPSAWFWLLLHTTVHSRVALQGERGPPPEPGRGVIEMNYTTTIWETSSSTEPGTSTTGWTMMTVCRSSAGCGQLRCGSRCRRRGKSGAVALRARSRCRTADRRAAAAPVAGAGPTGKSYCSSCSRSRR